MPPGPKPAQMAVALLEMLKGTHVHPYAWGGSPDLADKIPGSANIWKLRNACHLLYAYDQPYNHAAIEILNWWAEYATKYFLTEKEDLTSHPTYRGWISYPDVLAAQIARQMGQAAAAEQIETLNRSNIAHMAIGVCDGWARTLVRSNLEDPETPKLIVLDGPLSKVPNYVIQPGKRSLVRGDDGKFLGLDHLNLVSMLYQAAGIAPSSFLRNQCAWEWDVFYAIQRLFPPGELNHWGFSAPDVRRLQEFIANPENHYLASQIVAWMDEKPPSLIFDFIRYVDGSVIGRCEKSGSSSTGSQMAASWDAADGKVRIASCDNGFRDSGGDDDDVSPQISNESFDSILVSSSEHSVYLPKFDYREAYRVRTGPEGAFLFTEPGSGLPGPVDPPIPPVVARRRKKSVFAKLKDLFRKLKDLLN